jgi:hypothetical protein
MNIAPRYELAYPKYIWRQFKMLKRLNVLVPALIESRDHGPPRTS